MQVNWLKLLPLLKLAPALTLGLLKIAAENATLIPDAIAAAKTGTWLAFAESHARILAPLLTELTAAIQANPQILTDLIDAFLPATPVAHDVA